MNYLEHVKKVSGLQADVARLANVTSSSIMPKFVTDAKVSAPHDTKDGIGTLAGAAAGAIIGHKRGHVVLGAISGASLGRNLPALLSAADRNAALCNMGETAVAVACSKALPAHPVIGFIIGDVLARIALYYGGLRG